MAGLGIQTRGNGIAKVQRQNFKKGGKAFPDLTGDGKVTRADVLKGRGVFKKGGQSEVKKVMKEFKKGELHSGKKGPVVKSRKQAIAIALSEAGKSKTQRKKFGKGSFLKGMKKPKLIMKEKDFEKGNAASRRQSELIKKFNNKTITPKESQELENLEIQNILP